MHFSFFCTFKWAEASARQVWSASHARRVGRSPRASHSPSHVPAKHKNTMPVLQASYLCADELKRPLYSLSWHNLGTSKLHNRHFWGGQAIFSEHREERDMSAEREMRRGKSGHYFYLLSLSHADLMLYACLSCFLLEWVFLFAWLKKIYHLAL